MTKKKRQYLQPTTAVLWTEPVELLTASQGDDIPMTDHSSWFQYVFRQRNSKE